MSNLSFPKPPHPPLLSAPYFGHEFSGNVAQYGTGPVYQRTGTVSSVKTPGFKNLKRKNLPWNPYSINITENRWKSGQFGGVHRGNNPDPTTWCGYSGYIWNLFGYQMPLSEIGYRDEAANKALTKLLDKLKDSSVNLAQAWAERKQTVSMIEKSTVRIASAVLAIKKGQLRKAHQLFGQKIPSGRALWKHDVKPSPNNLANHWLEYSYGWKPLLSDIYGSAELISRTYNENRPSSVKVSARDIQNEDRINGTAASGSAVFRVRRKAVVEDRVTYTVEFKEDSAVASRLAQTGISNPLLLAWELVPYSFVVDWFLPVGTYLSAIDATNGLTFTRGSVSRVRSIDRVLTLINPNLGANGHNGQILEVQGVELNAMHRAKSRSILYSFPVANFPKINSNPLGIERSLSAISLLTQAFKR